MRTVKLTALLLALATIPLISGCAAMNYGTYAQHQATVLGKQADADAAIAKGLGQAATSSDARTQSQATMALLVMALTRKPNGLEAPREGALERGFGTMLTLIPGAAQAVGMASVLSDSGGSSSTTYNQSVSSGSSGTIGVGGATFGGNGLYDGSTITDNSISEPAE